MDRDSTKNSKRETDVGSGLTGVLSFLKQALAEGVRTIVICPGGRNAPMVQALELAASTWGLNVFSFFDERSAGFFALGRAQSEGRPVIVSTTSGTAAAELLPAVIEAQATCTPLIIATADRPRSHRGSGSPQSMVQVALYSQYASTWVDWQDGEEFIWPSQWDKKGPFHVNLCHFEPLWSPVTPSLPALPSTEKKSPWPDILAPYPVFKQPLVLLGALSADERAAVLSFCEWYQAPVLAEASSGLRECGSAFFARSADRVARQWLRDGKFDGVLRLGAVPSWRLWRDLEDSKMPIVSAGRNLWSGLPGRTIHTGDLDSWLKNWQSSGRPCSVRPDFHEADHMAAQKRSQLLEMFPLSEPAHIHNLSKIITSASHVYLGNSRPVRDWNEHAQYEKTFRITESRGLNGIDGQISTFYGQCQKEVNWALIGDLTALYDLQGPWAIRHLAQAVKTRLVVINNGGGKIFDRMFPSPLFLNKHEVRLKPLADLWGIEYSQDFTVDAQHALIEIFPDEGQTLEFRKQWGQV